MRAPGKGAHSQRQTCEDLDHGTVLAGSIFKNLSNQLINLKMVSVKAHEFHILPNATVPVVGLTVWVKVTPVRIVEGHMTFRARGHLLHKGVRPGRRKRFGLLSA